MKKRVNAVDWTQDVDGPKLLSRFLDEARAEYDHIRNTLPTEEWFKEVFFIEHDIEWKNVGLYRRINIHKDEEVRRFDEAVALGYFTFVRELSPSIFEDDDIRVRQYELTDKGRDYVIWKRL